MTQSEVRHFQDKMVTLFVINLLIAVLGPQFFTITGGVVDYLLAFLAGIVLVTIADRRYGRVSLWSTIFLLYLLWEMLLANIALAWLILQPKPNFHPAIFAVPLRVDTGLEITMLATAITLTPATLSLELLRDKDGQLTLYVHALQAKDPDAMRHKIRNGFEQLILRIMRGNGQ